MPNLGETMNRLTIKLLDAARRVVVKCHHSADAECPLTIDCEGQTASNLIRDTLLSPTPCMISRLGCTELKAILRHLNRSSAPSRTAQAWGYLTCRHGEFWWDDQLRWEMQYSSGFFPCTDKELARFAKRYLQDMVNVDILGSWLSSETRVLSYLRQATIVRLEDLEPYYHNDPWTTALEGLTVLVIHPFETSIRKQYNKREVLFTDRRILPVFTLKTLRAVQSLGGHASEFQTWFDALDWMCAQVTSIDFDVALIGAGAYGLPLAAFVKNLGKKAIHLGGATQILFGIRGKRWDDRAFFQGLFNEHWTRPLIDETPGSYNASGRSRRYFDDGRSYW
jgi:hypothetical protein